jgi:DNA repair exonuclease SbcCD ATPase subunit
MSLRTLKPKVQQLIEQYNQSEQRVRDERRALASAKAKVKATLQAQDIVQRLAQSVQENTHRQVASVVSKCLSAVFEEPYELHILFKRKRGKTEARLQFIRNGKPFTPLTATGGGVLDVAALALRLACIIGTRPAMRRLLVLDEPFKFVSKEYRPLIRKTIETLAKETNTQFLIVTHIRRLKAGKVYRLR